MKISYFLPLLIIAGLGTAGGVFLLNNSANSDIKGTIIILGSTFDTETHEITLNIQLNAEEAFNITTSSSLLFDVEIMDTDHWAINSVGLTVITNHIIPAGPSTFTHYGTLIQTIQTFAPIDPPDSITIRILLGNNALLASDSFQLDLT